MRIACNAPFAEPRETTGSVVLVRTADGLVLRPVRRRDRMWVRLRSARLDDELARGLTAEDDWLRAVRASELATAPCRAELAHQWDTMPARTARGGLMAPASLQRRAVQEAAGAIAELVTALRSPTPVDVRGVALARRLLTDGTGPLYQARPPEHLAAAVAAARRHLQPV